MQLEIVKMYNKNAYYFLNRWTALKQKSEQWLLCFYTSNVVDRKVFDVHKTNLWNNKIDDRYKKKTLHENVWK